MFFLGFDSSFLQNVTYLIVGIINIAVIFNKNLLPLMLVSYMYEMNYSQRHILGSHWLIIMSYPKYAHGKIVEDLGSCTVIKSNDFQGLDRLGAYSKMRDQGEHSLEKCKSGHTGE